MAFRGTRWFESHQSRFRDECPVSPYDWIVCDFAGIPLILCNSYRIVLSYTWDPLKQGQVILSFLAIRKSLSTPDLCSSWLVVTKSIPEQFRVDG